MVYAIRVPKEEAEKTKKKLVRSGLLDTSWKILEDGNFIIFPVKEEIEGSEIYELPKRSGKEQPYNKIVKKLQERDIFFKTPDKWEKIGNVVILQDFGADEFIMPLIGEVYARVLKAKTVAIQQKISGEFRENKIKIIWGKDAVTTHVENGIKYNLDLSKLMFSSGNIEERIRMSRINMANEVVVDMFAGIGYFTLPAQKAGALRIYACEKNPVAYYYLIKNIKANRADKVIGLYGDNRRVCPSNIADRIIMGYFDTLKFFTYALNYLKEEGGIIHYHDLVRDKNPDPLIQKLKDIAHTQGYEIRHHEKRIVKSYAPRVWHMVFDLKIVRK